MKRIWQLSLIFMLIFTGGCGIMGQKGGAGASEKLPETVAFQDEHTREFMDSPKEVEEGYYLFRSKTEGYTMLFPKGAKVAKMDYEQDNDSFETFSFSEKVEDENISYFVKITFEDEPSDNDINLSILSNSIGYNGEFQKYEVNDNEVFYATKKKKIQKEYVYNYLAYISDGQSDKGIQFVFSGSCIDKQDDCSLNIKKANEIINKIIKSIDFNQ